MEWLNYHHLLYFWLVAREGSVARACALLDLAQPTISGQLHQLEKRLKAKLFERVGRRLVLTDTGRLVYRYAEEIFTLGRELQDVLKGRSPGRPIRFVVGVAAMLPKLMVHHLLEPAVQLAEPIQLICHDGEPEPLLAQLALHELDLVLTDSPANPALKLRAFSHFLGECGVTICATPQLARTYRRGFPRSLDGAPMLLPTMDATLRRSLEEWFDAEGIRPVLRGEFADGALLKVFGQMGAGIFPVHTAVEEGVKRQFRVQVVGRVETIRERFYAISLERRLTHPAVVAISETARRRLR
jgi:LysR family transcriptional activator of nhaA